MRTGRSVSASGCWSSCGRLQRRPSSAKHLHPRTTFVRCQRGWPTRRTDRVVACRAELALAQRKCQACEPDGGALHYMGFCTALDREKADEFLQQLDSWKVVEDDQQRLRIRKQWRSKNFLKGLQLFDRIASVAESEGHHPDLHLEGWNRVSVELWTHARSGLTENDFIMAAKIDELPKDDLLRTKKKKKLPEA